MYSHSPLGGQNLTKSGDTRKDIQSLAQVTVELIQGYRNANGNVGLEDTARWEGTHIIDFLSNADRASTVVELLRVSRKTATKGICLYFTASTDATRLQRTRPPPHY